MNGLSPLTIDDPVANKKKLFAKIETITKTISEEVRKSTPEKIKVEWYAGCLNALWEVKILPARGLQRRLKIFRTIIYITSSLSGFDLPLKKIEFQVKEREWIPTIERVAGILTLVHNVEKVNVKIVEELSEPCI